MLHVICHQRMYENRFSPWRSWSKRDDAAGVEYPGIYALAYSSRNIDGKAFSWRKEIIYIGMTNAITGLKGRLKQFDNTISGKLGHGGADRVRFKHRDYSKLVKHLYVAVAPLKCDVTSNEPQDLRKMGEVAKLEYLCFAHFVEKFGELPEFNDKKKSPKYSTFVDRKNDR